jgi:hypothetical protein
MRVNNEWDGTSSRSFLRRWVYARVGSGLEKTAAQGGVQLADGRAAESERIPNTGMLHTDDSLHAEGANGT